MKGEAKKFMSFTDDDFNLIEEAAKLQGLSSTSFIRMAAVKAARHAVNRNSIDSMDSEKLKKWLKGIFIEKE